MLGEASRSQALLPTYTVPGLLLFVPVACGKQGKSGASGSFPAAQHYPALVLIVSPGACGIPGTGLKSTVEGRSGAFRDVREGWPS